MRLMPVHLVLGVAVLAALGALVVLAVRAVPAGEGSTQRARTPQRDESHSGSLSPLTGSNPVGTHGLRPSDNNQMPEQPDVIHYRYKVVKTYPHDRRFFTQGLVYEDGVVYEGTGLYGRSAIYRRDLQTGRVLKSLRLPDKYFGEGITLFDDKLIQLTWQSNVGFVYTKDTFTPLRKFKYRGEGWGLTHDDQRLILSDGTTTLRFLDPNTLVEIGRLEVRDQTRPVRGLNELEYVVPPPSGVADPQPAAAGPQIYANIWPTDQIVIIDPKAGRVTGRIDLSGLYTPPADEAGDSVLNGIAYLRQTRHLLVTGKLWPRMYEIELLRGPPENQ
jgi:glutamine cyclotransferase